jgi:general secretion pathway protein D
MRHRIPIGIGLAASLLVTTLFAQAPPIFVIPNGPPPQPQQPQQQQPTQQQQQQPGNPAAPPNAAAQTVQVQGNAAAPPRLADNGGFLLPNVSLTELIDIFAKRMKINYILDPRVKGTVTIYTYGEVRPVDLMPLLQTILRINGATIVQVGDLYRIVPLAGVSQLPMEPLVNADPKTLPDDERMVLNLIFLKYATVADLANLIKPFLGEGATASTYDPANLLLLLDNSRNMKRTMELIALFDSDTFAGQRVKLFNVSNGRPSDLVKELDSVFKAYALSDKSSAVKFVPVDRINTIIAVAPNPGIFAQVEDWIAKLDVQVKVTAGAVSNYVYRLKYERAETVAMAIMALYTGNVGALMSLASSLNQGGAAGFGGMGVGAAGFGAGGMNYGAGYGAGGYGGYNGYGGYGGSGAYGGYGNYNAYATTVPPPTTVGAPGVGPVAASGTAAAAPGTSPDLTGSYLGSSQAGLASPMRIPHVIPNPFDNTLLIQATPQEYDQITGLLQQLDVPPRQVLIEAKIYEVDLTGAFAAGVNAFLQSANAADGAPITTTNGVNPSRVLGAVSGAGGLGLTTGALVLKSHELLAVLTASENHSRTRVISAPSIIATDSVPASMNVGESVPILTSQAVGGVQQGGSSLFANTVSNQSTGVTLAITARVNSSGVVTMIINQQVSSPQAPTAGGIQSPSFQNRSFQTQVTVQDGDTIAIGGIIQQSKLEGVSGIPFLDKIPVIGTILFGSKSTSTARTELIVFLTPRVIYDTNQLADATDEVKSNLKEIQRMMKKDQP